MSDLTWRGVTTWVLEGTTFELRPEYGSGLWFLVDTRHPDRKVVGPLDLAKAKQAAERRVLEKQKERIRGE